MPDAATRTALVHTSPTKRGADCIRLLEQLDRAYGPVPGQTRKPVVLVLDNGPIHTGKATTKAPAARPWITVERLPRHAPEQNAIEGTWRDLKRHHLAHRTFRDDREAIPRRERPRSGPRADLDRAIHRAVAELNRGRAVAHPCRRLPRAA